jgi:hypothetical protein
VFISYAREDRSWVELLGGDLTALGHDVWFDSSLLGGQHWWAEILRQIREADLLVFVLSPSSIDSLTCLTELRYANYCRRRMLPVMVRRISPSAIPADLAHAHFVDYTAHRRAGELSRAVAGMPPAPDLPDPLPPPPALPEPLLALIRRRVLFDATLTRGGQHELVDDILREARRPGQWGDAYDVLMLLTNRPDLLVEVGKRVEVARDQLWKIGSKEEKVGRDPRPWSWGYVTGVALLGYFLTLGVASLVIGLRNRRWTTRRTASWVLIGCGLAPMLFLTVSLVTAAITPDIPTDPSAP